MSQKQFRLLSVLWNHRSRKSEEPDLKPSNTLTGNIPYDVVKRQSSTSLTPTSIHLNALSIIFVVSCPFRSFRLPIERWRHSTFVFWVRTENEITEMPILCRSFWSQRGLCSAVLHWKGESHAPAGSGEETTDCAVFTSHGKMQIAFHRRKLALRKEMEYRTFSCSPHSMVERRSAPRLPDHS
jgi:hypothetical protein